MKHSKLLLVIMAMLVALCLSFTACQMGTRDDLSSSVTPSESLSPSQSDSEPDSSDPIDEITLTLDHSSLTMRSGDVVTVTATVTGTDEEISWSSDNDQVATVADGVISAIGEGSATITASVGDKTATVAITVADEKELLVETSALVLDATTMEVNDGVIGVTEKDIVASFTVNGATVDAEIAYSSSKNSVATVSAEGRVSAVSAGEAYIYVTCNYKGVDYEKEVKVTVEKLLVDSGVSYTFGGDKSKWEIDVTELGFTPADVTEIYLANGGDDFVQVDPSTGEIIYNGNSAKVITDGIDIESKTEPDVVNVCTDKLIMQVKVVYVTANNVEFVSEVSPMLIGSQKQLELYIFGVKADIDEVEWSVNKEHIATVDQNGLVTAVNYGTAIITAKAYGYTYTTQQVVHKELPVDSGLVNDAFSVHNYVDGSDRSGLLISTHGVYDAGDWVSFQFTPSAEISHGMLFVLFGELARNTPQETEGLYPNGIRFATLGAENYRANLWTDSSCIVLDKDGRQVGSIKTGEGFGALNANETYTVYVQIPDDGNPVHDILAYFARNEVELDPSQAGQGVVAWRDYMLNHDVAISFPADGYNGYIYNGETRNEIQKDDVFTLNVADLANNNRIDLSAWGIEEEILLARIDGINEEVFVTEGGKPVFDNGALLLKSGFEGTTGTEGERTLIIETDNNRYLAKINLIPIDENMPGAIHLYDGGFETEILNGAAFNSTAASNTYAFINFYVNESFPTGTYFYVLIAARHVFVNNSYIYNHSLGWQNDNGYCGDVIDVYRLSDGALIVDQPENGSVLEANTWYTMVIDLRARFWTESEAIAQNDGLKIKTVGINAYINGITYGNSKSMVLDKTAVNATVGDEITLSATTPDFINGEIVWASDNEEVATVVDGVVTTLKAGIANITATIGGFSASCAITVQNPPSENASIILRIGDVIYDELTVVTGSVIEAPVAPTMVGLVFDGWYSGSEKIDFANAIESNYILEARYVPNSNAVSNSNAQTGEGYSYTYDDIVIRASDAFDAMDAGREYFVIKITPYSSLADKNNGLFFEMLSRHFVLTNNQLYVWSYANGWDPTGSLPSDTMEIYDAKGNLVTDYVIGANGATWNENPTMGTLTAGQTYTLVLNMYGGRFNRQNLLAMSPSYDDAWANGAVWFRFGAIGGAQVSMETIGAMTKEDAIDLASPRANVTFMLGDKVLESKEVVIGSALVAPTVPQMLSNTFNGWFLDGVLFDLSQGIAADTVLVANYSIVDQNANATGNGNWIRFNGKETYLTGLETYNNVYKNGTPYYAFDITLHKLPAQDGHIMYFSISGAHFSLCTNGIYCVSCEWDCGAMSHAADTVEIYDKKGVLVNNLVVGNGWPEATATGLLKQGETYTIVLNLASLRWTEGQVASFGMTPEEFFTQNPENSVFASQQDYLFEIKKIGAMSKQDVIDMIDALTKATVTYRVGDIDYSSSKVLLGQSAEEISAPALSGWVFDGWYLGDAKYDFASPVEANVTLVAKYVLSSNVSGAAAAPYAQYNKYLDDNAIAATDALVAIGEGKSFFALTFTLYDELGDGDASWYFELLGRHFLVHGNGIELWSSQWDTSKAMPANSVAIYDAEGNLVNNRVYYGSTEYTPDATANALEVGKTYTMIIDMNAGQFLAAEKEQYGWADDVYNGAVFFRFGNTSGKAMVNYTVIGAKTADEISALIAPQA